MLFINLILAKMATDSKTKPTYYIFYGFLCGPAHSKKLRQKLAEKGFAESNSPDDSDIIIAHSAGCWEVPKDNNARLIVFVGMTLASQNSFNSFVKSNYYNARTAFKNHTFLSSLSGIILKNLYYGIKQPIRNFRIAKKVSGKKDPQRHPTAIVLFVANEYDPWPHIPELNILLKKNNYNLVELSGSHDDIWQNPNPYINLIEQNV